METDKNIKNNQEQNGDETVKTSNTFTNPSDENQRFVEFSILLTEEDRKELYKVLNNIKETNNLKTFAESVMFLVRR